MVSLQELQADLVQIGAQNYFSLSSFVVLYFDYLLTLDDEVRFFWGRKANLVTVLFFVNRYLSLFGAIPVVLHEFPILSQMGCGALYAYNEFFIVVTQVIVGTILALRTYALYERSRNVWWLLAILLVCGIALSAWSMTGLSSSIPIANDVSAILGCHSALTGGAGLRISAASIILLVYDTVIFTLTLWKAFAARKLSHGRLMHVVARDGAVYYFIVALANLSNILTFALAPPASKGASSALASVMSVTLISRLMLNIQKSSSMKGDLTHSSCTEASSDIFVTTILSLEIEDEEENSGIVESAPQFPPFLCDVHTTRRVESSGPKYL